MKKFLLLLIISPFFVLSQSKKELTSLLEQANDQIEAMKIELYEHSKGKKELTLLLEEANNEIEIMKIELNKYNKYIGQILHNDDVLENEGSDDNRCYIKSNQKLFTGYVYTGNFYIDPNGIKQFERTKYVDGVIQYRNYSNDGGGHIKHNTYQNGKKHGVQIEWEIDDLYITYRADNQKLFGWKISNNTLQREKIYNYKNGGFKYTSYLDNGTIKEQRCNDDAGKIIQCE